MKRMALIWLFVMTVFLGTASWFFLREGGSNVGPRYTLEALKRQWNVNAMNPKAHIGQGRETAAGYLVEYGDGLTLLAAMQERLVTGVHIRFQDSPENAPGGPRFLLLMNAAMNIGTFRWPQQRNEAMRKMFAYMTPDPKSYRYRNSLFSRTFVPNEGWEFTLEFVPVSETDDTP